MKVKSVRMVSSEKSQDLDVRFRSNFVKNKIGKKVRLTTCSIAKVKVNEQGRREFEVVVAATATQNSKDQDIRKKGQKIAFAQAVRKFTKEQRTELWDTFKKFKSI